jgi:hypothetical protein
MIVSATTTAAIGEDGGKLLFFFYQFSSSSTNFSFSSSDRTHNTGKAQAGTLGVYV